MKHRATLLTNYRCSHALLSLPSYLFYNSALVTEAKSSHSKALHFICSSLDNDSLEVTVSQNEQEADDLLEFLEKYQQTHEWEPKSVCMMATTGNQVIKGIFKTLLFCLFLRNLILVKMFEVNTSI